MKYKTTAKAIKNGTCVDTLFSAGYCTMCYLLSCETPVAYTAGVYGWNFDVYRVEGYTICTGYRGMPGRPLKGVAEYEERAKSICSAYRTSFSERKAELRKLLVEMLSKQREGAGL